MRLVPGTMERMIDMLDWMGMTPDEGPIVGGDYGPYVQVCEWFSSIHKL